MYSRHRTQTELLFLGGHDPYLDQRNRLILQPDKSLHRKIRQLVANPGAIIYRGEIVGIGNSRKKGKVIEKSLRRRSVSEARTFPLLSR